MRMKAAHLVSVLIVVAVLLAALPSPSAVREPRDPATTRTTEILATTTSSVHTIVTTTNIATTTRHSSSVPTRIQSSVPICVVQVGLVQQDGSTEWIGMGITEGETGAPISACQNTAGYFTDAVGGTVALNQFIVNATSSSTP
jgi:hypothetical protein